MSLSVETERASKCMHECGVRYKLQKVCISTVRSVKGAKAVMTGGGI